MATSSSPTTDTTVSEGWDGSAFKVTSKSTATPTFNAADPRVVGGQDERTGELNADRRTARTSPARKRPIVRMFT